MSLGSEADILGDLRDVRFAPESGHRLRTLGCVLSAKSGHAEHLGSA